MAGIKGVPRTSQAQWSFGKPVPIHGLRPGDLVFSEPGPGGPGHVGIYIGNGRIESSPHTGATVHISTMAQFGSLMGARRILANPQGNVVQAGNYPTPQGNQPLQSSVPKITLPTIANPALTSQQALQSALKPQTALNGVPSALSSGPLAQLQAQAAPPQTFAPLSPAVKTQGQLGALHDSLLKLTG